MSRLDKKELCRLIDMANNPYRSRKERMAAAAKLSQEARKLYMSLLDGEPKRAS